MKLLSLRAGRLGLELAPQAGGSIARFTADGSIDLLRPTQPEALASGRGNESSCYPLVPFSGRIANGRLAFDGTEIVLKPNWPGGRHPMHGDGWARPWTATRSDAQSADIVYEHDGREGWPFRYRARQTYRLESDTLTVAMSIENLESRVVPAGLGLHPFFVRDADTELACRAQHAWRTDAEVLPIERIAVPHQWDFATSRRVDGVTVDSGFEGWDGRATIRWPRAGLRLDMTATEPFRALVIYIPPNRPYCCVEPVSHVPGAIAATRLAAGATLAGEIAFRISNL
ncbi:MAG TPA: aldose 1-epimerase [Reyranella sp.]|jgi:aldose 1-epimerase|nr:aldose 1-epimerase [Reyranella sp.]